MTSKHILLLLHKNLFHKQFSLKVYYFMDYCILGDQKVTNINLEIIPTALESLLMSSFLNSVFEVWLYGSTSIGSLFIGFALTFGFADRDVLDFRSRFFKPEVAFMFDDRFALSPDDFLSCTLKEFLKIHQ